MKLGIILNGPPGCGKDTLANMLVKSLPLTHFIKHQFKDALYEHTAKHFGIDVEQFIHYASDRVLKDSKSLAGLGGRTPRQALIHVSEDIYKPRHGNDYFGQVEAARLRELSGRLGGTFAVVYPDGGFADEVRAVEREFDRLLYVRLHRAGFSFAGDSRSYVRLPDTDILHSYDVELVDGAQADGLYKIVEILDKEFPDVL